jgi:hypothetical protein
VSLVSSLVGLALILVVLRDVVHELFDPEDTGSLSRAVMKGVWGAIRLVGRWRRSAIYHAGALVLVSVALMWTGLLTLGFALVYWPRLPDAFHVDSSLPAAATRGFGTALYVSLGSLTTLGSSDIVPVADGVRYAGTVESLLGVAVITAWITWVLSIYPVVSRRRAFARGVDLVCRTHPPPERAVVERPATVTAELLRSLTEQVLRVTSDLGQTRVTYYFQNRTPELSLARQIPHVLALADAARHASVEPALQHHGALLRQAVEGLLGEIGAQFLDLRDAPPERVLAALERDHLLTRDERSAS